MQKSFLGIFFFILITGVISCQKSSSSDNQFSESGDTSLLKSFLILDSSYNPSRDTILKCFFSYDDNKRVTTLKEFLYNKAIDKIDFATEFRYFYLGADTLPYKVFVVWSKYTWGSSPVPYIHSAYDTVSLSYQDGEIVRDSCFYGQTLSGFSYEILEFSKLSSSRYKMTFSVNGVISTNTLYSTIQKQSGNLIQEIDSLYIGSSNEWNIYGCNFMYDLRPNPLRKLLFAFPLRLFYMSGYYQSLYGPFVLKNFVTTSANNITREEHFHGVTTDVITWNYVYGANGLPQKATRKKSIGSGDYILRYIYKYTGL